MRIEFLNLEKQIQNSPSKLRGCFLFMMKNMKIFIKMIFTRKSKLVLMFVMVTQAPRCCPPTRDDTITNFHALCT